MKLRKSFSVAALAAVMACTAPGLAAADPPHRGKHGHGHSRGHDHGWRNHDKHHSPKHGGRQWRNQHHGHHYHGHHDDRVARDLIRAGISAAMARRYAYESGFGGSYVYVAPSPRLRMDLVRGRTLPPGIARKLSHRRMLTMLPVYPGYEWRVVGPDLILVSAASAVIADVIYDVFTDHH